MILPAGAKNLSQAVQMGAETFHALKKLLKNEGIPNITDTIPLYKELYAFRMPDIDADGAGVYAHKEVWQHTQALTGRSMDGGPFLDFLGYRVDLDRELRVRLVGKLLELALG